MKKSSQSLSRSQKIILELYNLSKEEKKNIKLEDIAVALFRKYPDEFHLEGYPEYPYSGDSIQRALYEFRQKGIVEANNKIFSLTKRGLVYVSQLRSFLKEGEDNLYYEEELSRYIKEETKRIVALESFKMFINNEKASITDTDFYKYLDVTVRTKRSDFLGKLNNRNEFIKELKSVKFKKSFYKEIIKYHNFMIRNFKHIIEIKSQ
jgi:hypothetical protein